MWYDLAVGYSRVLTPSNLLCVVGGSMIGILVGAFPALDTAVAVALLVPLSSLLYCFEFLDLPKQL